MPGPYIGDSPATTQQADLLRSQLNSLGLTATEISGNAKAKVDAITHTAGSIRPYVAAVLLGHQHFDTLLGKPVWSNGTDWVDAMGASTFRESDLFADGSQGIWLNLQDDPKFYSDTAGTVPANYGDAVALALDQSKGLAATELVTNGNFSSATGWTLSGAGITIANDVLSFAAAAAGAAANYTGGLPVSINDLLEITYTVASISGGSVRAQVGGLAGVPRNGPGTYTERVIATATTPLAIVALAAGTTATIDNLSMKKIAGNHFTQPTFAARPIYGRHPKGGRRNLLTNSEDFANAAWTKSATATVTPSGGAFIFRPGATVASQLYPALAYAADPGTFTVHVDAKPETANWLVLAVLDSTTGSYRRFWFNLSTGTLGGAVSNGTTITAPTAKIEPSPAGSGFFRCSFTFSCITAVSLRCAVNIAQTDGAIDPLPTDGVYILREQLERGSLTPYQRVGTSAYDITEAGVPDVRYLYATTDDWMVTPAIDFTGTDKMTVFAGLQKLGDTSTMMLAELGENTNLNAGSFMVYTGPGSIITASRGNAGVDGAQAASSALPNSSRAVVTATHDIPGDLSTIRRNGVAGTGGTWDKGLGNFRSAPLFLFSRAGTSLFFNGYLYDLLVVGKKVSAAQIATIENKLNAKIGAY